MLIDMGILKEFWVYHNIENKHYKQINTLFAFEFLLLFLKTLLPYIKYLINLLEVLTFSHFFFKQTFFSALDFFFTSTRLIIQILVINFIRINLGLPLHLIADTIENFY